MEQSHVQPPPSSLVKEFVLSIRCAAWDDVNQIVGGQQSPEHLLSTPILLEPANDRERMTLESWCEGHSRADGKFPYTALHQFALVYFQSTSDCEDMVLSAWLKALQVVVDFNLPIGHLVKPASIGDQTVCPLLEILVDRSSNKALKTLLLHFGVNRRLDDDYVLQRANLILSRAIQDPRLENEVVSLLAYYVASPGFDHVNNAVLEKRSFVLDSLVQAGVSLEEKDDAQMTALATCCKLLSQDMFQCIQQLLELGADPLTRCVYGRNALHFLCVPTHQNYTLLKETIQRILRISTDILHCFDDFGFKPLDYAVDRNNITVTRAMLDSFMVDVPFHKICQCPVRLKVLDTTYSAGNSKNHGMKVNRKLSEAERVTLVWYNHFTNLRYPIVRLREFRRLHGSAEGTSSKDE